MGTIIRPELSMKNLYWIEKHRYYELKHFCLQYPIWQKAYLSLDGLSKWPIAWDIFCKNNICSNPTANCAMAKSFYLERIDMVRRTADNTDLELSNYILKAVTEGRSYSYLKSRLDIPCSKNIYYDRYRKFFWLLNRERQ